MWPRLMPGAIAAGVLLIAACLRTPTPNSQLVNGDFEQPLNVGWTTRTEGSGSNEVERDSTLGQPTPGFAACVAEINAGSARLSQSVLLPNLDYSFDFDGCFVLGGSLSCGPAAAVVLSFLDESDVVLGTTRWFAAAFGSWTQTDTSHLIPVGEREWQHQSIRLSDELTEYLTGVNRSAVSRVKVELLAQVASSG